MQISQLQQYNPTPTSFPYDTSDTFSTFEGYPDALSNGYLLDLNIQPKDKALLRKAAKSYPQNHLASALHYLADNSTHLIPDSDKLQVQSGLLIFIITHYLTQVNFGIQVRHWNYMRYRYPSCQFFYGRCEHADIVVKERNQVVGVITPVQEVL